MNPVTNKAMNNCYSVITLSSEPVESEEGLHKHFATVHNWDGGGGLCKTANVNMHADDDG